MNSTSQFFYNKREDLKNNELQFNNQRMFNQTFIQKSRSFTFTSIKDFEIQQEFPSVNKNLKLHKATRKMDNKEYILGIYPLKLIANNNFSKKLEEITEIMKTLLTKINCINVINIKESFIDKSKDNIVIVLELFQNKTLSTELLLKYKKMKEKCIPELLLLDCLKQIVKGLLILHDNNIYNINLDPQNIYYSEEIENNNILIKINPYSSLESLSCSRKCNNKYFNILAPELLKNKKSYSEKTDIWYLGLLIYELSQLKTLDNTLDNIIYEKEDIYNSIIKGTYNFNNYYFNDIKGLIKSCLQYSAKRRVNAHELLSLIELYKNNFLVNKRISDFNITHKKLNIDKSKITLKEEIDKYNNTLSKIQQYEKRKNLFRNTTPINERKNFQKINLLNPINRRFPKRIRMSGNFENEQKSQIKTNCNNENANNVIKTGKKFFQIRKNYETFKGYVQIPDRTEYYNYDYRAKRYSRSKTPNNIIKTNTFVDFNSISKLCHPKKLSIFDGSKNKHSDLNFNRTSFKKDDVKNKRKFQSYKKVNHKNLNRNACKPNNLYKEKINIISYKKPNKSISKTNSRKHGNKLTKSVNLGYSKMQIESKNKKLNDDIIGQNTTIEKKNAFDSTQPKIDNNFKSVDFNKPVIDASNQNGNVE